MAEVRYVEEADVAASIDDVFAYRLDFAHLPLYNPNVTDLHRTDEGIEPDETAEYVFNLEISGASIVTPLRIVSVDAPTTIVIETGPNYMARETCTFTPNGAGTHVVFDTTLTIDGELDDETSEMIATQGREQVRLELDNLARLLGGR